MGRHNGNSFIAHQSFANANLYETTYTLTSFLIVLNSGRNTNNGTSFVRKPSANSNKTSMSFELCTFQDGIKSGGEDTIGTCRPFGKSAMIRSNSPNFQILDDTRDLRA